MDSWLLIIFVILLFLVGSYYQGSSASIEGFELCQRDPVEALYANWGNGGIKQNDYLTFVPSQPQEVPFYYSSGSVRNPTNTLVDQLICKNYADRTCLDVFGCDRYDHCMAGQYDSCMDGRKRLIWATSAWD
jgi:hypothetical protein